MLTQHNDRVITSLPSIRVPALVMAGENDTPYLAGTDYMAGKIPNAVKHIIPDAGHAVNIDQPGLFNETVISFDAAQALTCASPDPRPTKSRRRLKVSGAEIDRDRNPQTDGQRHRL